MLKDILFGAPLGLSALVLGVPTSRNVGRKTVRGKSLKDIEIVERVSRYDSMEDITL